jgi:para-nitrobenzyl esterase
VNTLVASPLAKGLFIRAIGQSGGRFSRTPLLREDRGSQPSAESVGLAAAKTLGADSLAALRQVPADRLAALTVRTQENVDGWVLPDEIRSIFAKGQQNIVPAIVGSTADEMTSLGGASGAPKTLDALRARLQQQYGELAGEFETVYGVRSEADIAPARPSSKRSTRRRFPTRSMSCPPPIHAKRTLPTARRIGGSRTRCRRTG